MDSRKLVLTETAVVAAGETLGAAAVVGIFALLHRYDSSVLWGSIAGTLIAVGNFFFMALGAMSAADKAAQDDVKDGNAAVRSSMFVRLAVMALLLIVCAKSGYCNLIALLVPLLLSRPILTVYHFFGKPGEQA